MAVVEVKKIDPKILEIINFTPVELKNFVLNKCFENDFKIPKDDSLCDKRIVLEDNPVNNLTQINASEPLPSIDFSASSMKRNDDNSNEITGTDKKNAQINAPVQLKRKLQETTYEPKIDIIESNQNKIQTKAIDLTENDDSESVSEESESDGDGDGYEKGNFDTKRQKLDIAPSDNINRFDILEKEISTNGKIEEAKKLNSEQTFDLTEIQEKFLQKITNNQHKFALNDVPVNNQKTELKLQNSFCFEPDEYYELVLNLTQRTPIQIQIGKFVSYNCSVFVDLIVEQYNKKYFTESAIKHLKYGLSCILSMLLEDKLTLLFQNNRSVFVIFGASFIFNALTEIMQKKSESEKKETKKYLN
jgi:hypothetical protein